MQMIGNVKETFPNLDWHNLSYRQTLVSSDHTAAILVEVHVLVDLHGGQAPRPLDHVTGQLGLLLP